MFYNPKKAQLLSQFANLLGSIFLFFGNFTQINQALVWIGVALILIGFVCNYIFTNLIEEINEKKLSKDIVQATKERKSLAYPIDSDWIITQIQFYFKDEKMSEIFSKDAYIENGVISLLDNIPINENTNQLDKVKNHFFNVFQEGNINVVFKKDNNENEVLVKHGIFDLMNYKRHNKKYFKKIHEGESVNSINEYPKSANVFYLKEQDVFSLNLSINIQMESLSIDNSITSLMDLEDSQLVVIVSKFDEQIELTKLLRINIKVGGKDIIYGFDLVER